MESDFGSQRNASPTRSDDDERLLEILRRQHASSLPTADNLSEVLPVPFETPESHDLFHSASRATVPGLPRAQTFKRQQSEQRINLTPVETPLEERRAFYSDRRANGFRKSPLPHEADLGFYPPSTFDPYQRYLGIPFSTSPSSVAPSNMSQRSDFPAPPSDGLEAVDNEVDFPIPSAAGMAEHEYEALIEREMDNLWILNLSMHYRDGTAREKFFVTFRQREHLWRRVTVSMDYRSAEPNSLEFQLRDMRLQRDKITRIYEEIRDQLPTIVWSDGVTNLKLQTINGHLNIHVVEDGNETITFPSISQISHLNCKLIKESHIMFDSHLAGFVYKVRADNVLVTFKDLPGQDTVDEFLYEINALYNLRFSSHIVRFYGIVVDDEEKHIKGLLIAYADQGALVDILYDECRSEGGGIPWRIRERWGRQIIQGLADIHETGYVQGDFTLSNVVVDSKSDAKIIDINRRGCPLGWEPPEAAPLVESGQRITLYIGVKSDLFQLGMILWALAMEEDEPEAQGRPLVLGPEVNIPDWYRQITEICLSHDPRQRLSGSALANMIPPQLEKEAADRLPIRAAQGRRPDTPGETAASRLSPAPRQEQTRGPGTPEGESRSGRNVQLATNRTRRGKTAATSDKPATGSDEQAADAMTKPEVARSWASRPSTPDGEFDGGAELARSEAG